MFNLNEKQRFSLRKLSVGLASVCIGLSFVNMTSKEVKADTVSVQTSVAETKTSENKVNADATKEVANSTNSVDSNKITPSQTALNKQATSNDALKGTDVKQEQPVETKQETPVKQAPVNEQPTVSNKDANINLNKNYNKQALETSLLKDTNKPETTNTFHVRKFNIQANINSLKESKAVDSNTNGGFDSSWGTLDVNDWKGSVQGDYYQLNDYTGDANHVIVPNEADFEKAGISTSGKQVGVTSDLMHTIFRDKTTAQDATVAFSKTGNKMVKAIGTDWHNTWGHDYSTTSEADLSKFDGTNLDVSNVTNMSGMFFGDGLSDLSSLANWDTSNVTNMISMFYGNNISDLSPLANWKVDKVTDISDMFNSNQISDLSPLANWNVNNVTNISSMFNNNQISDLSPLSKWDVSHVTDMSGMVSNNQINDLSPLSNWHTDNVTNMSSMFGGNQISDLSPLANWHTDKVTNMREMFIINQISDLSPLANWKVDHVNNMQAMFNNNQISDLSPLANWHTDKVTNMNWMFSDNHISDLSPLTNWKVDKVTDMSYMFYSNHISDLSPLSNWNVNNVTYMNWMFDGNSSIQTKTTPANRIINFVYPEGYADKKQDSVTQTIDVPTKQVKVELTTKYPKPSNNILDWVTKTETPISTPIDPVYFQDYRVPTVANLVPSISTVAKQEADPNTPLNVVVTYTAAPVTVHFKDVDENADKDSDAVKNVLNQTMQLSGTYGSNVDLSTVKLPANFVLDDTSSNTFGNTTDAYINLKHQHAKSTAQAPATRTIVVHMPDGSTKTYVQTIGFVNNFDKDLVTNKTTNIYTVDASKSNVTVNGTVDSSIGAYRKTGNDDANGTNYKFASFVLPKIPGYKARIKPVSLNPNMMLFSVSFMAIPQFKPDVTQKVKPEPVKPTTVEVQVPVETHNLDNYTLTTNDSNPDTRVFNNIESNDLTWQIGNKNLNNNSINVPYYLTNTIYKLRLPRFSNYELHLVKRGTTQDSVSFVYVNKQTQLNYVFNLKIQDNKYYLTVDKIDRVNRKILPIKTYNVISYQDLLDIFDKYFK